MEDGFSAKFNLIILMFNYIILLSNDIIESTFGAIGASQTQVDSSGVFIGNSRIEKAKTGLLVLAFCGRMD